MTAGSKSSGPNRGTVLPVIALCFLASAVLRGVLVANAASTPVDEQKATMIAEQAKEAMDTKAPDQGASCDASSLIGQLKIREGEFERREATLNERAARLDVVEARLKERIAALEEAREALEATVARVDGAQSRDIEHLVTMYSTMKAKRAGELFNEMDVKFASELLVRAKPEVAAMILANMDSDKAFTASLMIARRNQSAPKK